jgi:prepilin-type N-terminal cleavage/methylation domain-containing protein
MNRKRSGFTLMELVVVVAILAAMAGLVISKIDWIRRQANMAIGAETSADVAQNIQMYLAATEELPSGLDSLVTSAGALYSGPSTGGGSGGIIGQTDDVGNIPTQASVGTLSSNQLNSLFRMGMLFVNDMSTSATNASDAGTVYRSLGSYSSTGKTLNTSGSFVLVTAGSAIWNAVFPPNVWNPTGATLSGTSMSIDPNGDTASLVCLGVGPGNSMIGNTMISPPQYPGPDSNVYYYRYVAVFIVYSNGSRAQLGTVIDPYGRVIDSSIQQYSTSGPDGLPTGARTPE